MVLEGGCVSVSFFSLDEHREFLLGVLVDVNVIADVFKVRGVDHNLLLLLRASNFVVATKIRLGHNGLFLVASH